MNKKVIIAISSAFVVLILAFTNPNQEVHKNAVKQKFNAYMQKKVNGDEGKGNDGFNIGGQLGMMLGSALIEKLVDANVSSQNFILFSLTTFTFNGESRVMGVGVLGNVFISDKVDEELDKKIDNVGL